MSLITLIIVAMIKINGSSQTKSGIDLIKFLSIHKPIHADSPKPTINWEAKPAYCNK